MMSFAASRCRRSGQTETGTISTFPHRSIARSHLASPVGSASTTRGCGLVQPVATAIHRAVRPPLGCRMTTERSSCGDKWPCIFQPSTLHMVRTARRAAVANGGWSKVIWQAGQVRPGQHTESHALLAV